MTQKLAFVGIGQMGGNMARRLTESGFDVLGYDVSERSRETAETMGIATTDQLLTALEGRQMILSSLPDPRIVREAWLGKDGILEHAGPGAIGIELSTIDPATMREVAAAARAKGVRMIDAPVSGGPAECAAGTLVIMVGGERDDIAAADTVLKALSSSYHYTGVAGTAKTVKIVNNMMSMGNVVVAAEAFALGTAAGVEPRLLFDVLSHSGGRSHHFLKRFPKALDGDFSPGFKLELGEKDVALGIELARSLHQPTPASSVVREMMSIGLATGHRGRDVVAMLDLYNKMSQ
jgi:3-hydroxyisobutyrate dehydrogenase-like beta-hydroxyacid dehydrogenase